MSIRWSSEVANRQAVMHLRQGLLSTYLTLASSAGDGFVSRGVPTYPVASGCAALPSRVIRSSVVLRLPLSHAGTRTERLFAMEVRGGATKGLAAPLAGLSYPIASSRVGFPGLPLDAASKRTEALGAFAGTGSRLPAYDTRWGYGFAPTCFEFAGDRAISLGLLRAPSVLRMVGCTALVAVARYIDVLHTAILSRHTRYCEVAANRLAQTVMQLEGIT